MAEVIDEIVDSTRRMFELFLDEFTGDEDMEREPASTTSQICGKEYVEQVALMKQNDLTTIYVDYAHVTLYDDQLADNIALHYIQVEEALQQAVYNCVGKHAPDHLIHKSGDKLFYVSFYNFPTTSTLRDLKCNKIGQLVAVCGTVTRSSQVRPELIRGTFRCLECTTENKNVRQQFKYTEPKACFNPVCQNRDNWSLITTSSQFVDWQMVRVQENAQDIPAGSMPRSIKIILRNEIVEQTKPGDKSVFTGTLVVVPDVAQMANGGAKSVRRSKNARGGEGKGVTGLKSLGVRDLTYKLAFLATSVRSQHATVGSMNAREEGEEEHSIEQDFTLEERQRILEMKNMTRVYSRMVKSIAPTIFGHEEIKRGVLLMLMGGVHKKTPDGASLRGDINVCVVGDPSTSKSQFLKYVCAFLPRAVYTSGKASSAAGLTASVVRDQETGEFSIEAGALMLADNSICCIDEFDKMDVKDQVAIHEAMEQQTISIAKAGIQATLNARTSILAAANPIQGRYDRSRTLKQNVDISAPIMSRFDLFFVVLDECNDVIDYAIARHIVATHRGQPRTTNKPDFTISDLQTYIRFARSLKPQVNAEAKKCLVDKYVELRGNDAAGAHKTSYRITVRQLESMIRLAEARARVDLQEEITKEHVMEAARLLQQSVVHVESGDVPLEQEEQQGLEEGAGEAEEDSKEERAEGETEEGPLTVAFSEYQRISNMIVMYLRRREEAGQPGLKKMDIVNWYLSEIQSEVTTTKELKHHTRVAKAVIGRLADVDNVLIPVGPRGKEERPLGVHPNYNIEDDTGGQALYSEDELSDSSMGGRTELSGSDDDGDMSAVSSIISGAIAASQGAPASPGGGSVASARSRRSNR